MKVEMRREGHLFICPENEFENGYLRDVFNYPSVEYKINLAGMPFLRVWPSEHEDAPGAKSVYLGAPEE